MEIPATEFKAKCLKLMDRDAKTHESIVITKRGKPVAKLMPIDKEPQQEPFGYMAGTMEITGDIVSPIEQEWSVLTGDEDDLYGDLIVRIPEKKDR